MRAAWAIEKLQEVHADLVDLYNDCTDYHARIMGLGAKLEAVLETLRGEQAYQAKVEDDTDALYGDKDKRRGLWPQKSRYGTIIIWTSQPTR